MAELEADSNTLESADGLLKHYDAVILGTGLVESILASALARAGKTVLHLDKNDFYGGSCASFPLEQLCEWAQQIQAKVPSQIDGSSEHRSTEDDVSHHIAEARRILQHHQSQEDEFKAGESLGPLLLVDIHAQGRYPAVDVIEMTEYHRRNHSSRQVASASHPAFIGYDPTIKSHGGMEENSSNVHPVFNGYNAKESRVVHPNLEDCMKKGRRFNIDLTAKILLSAGEMVTAMVNSNVARYLEFKGIDKLFYTHASKENNSVGGDKVSIELNTIPCSKQDVFKSTLLNALEKRVLMKFLQFASDWGRLEQGTEVITLNENELAQGRSLNRPQNKQVSEYDLTGFEDRPFVEFLAHCKIPERLRHLIVYGLALWPHSYEHGTETELRTVEGVRAVARHVNALGRFGDTAFLAPLYGSSEIPQAFCRMCAVSGGTYILRRSVVQLALDSESRVRGIVDSTGRITSCDIFACSPDYLPAEYSQTNPTDVVTRVSILDRKIFDQADRAVAIIPPGSNNPNPIHIVQLDSGMYVCPDDVVLVYLTTSTNNDVNPALVLASAMESLATAAGAREIWHLTTRQTLAQIKSTNTLPTNLCVCGDTSQELTFHSSVEKAKQLFEQVCPGGEFLPATVVDTGEGDEEAEYMHAIMQSIAAQEEEAHLHEEKYDHDVVEPANSNSD